MRMARRLLAGLGLLLLALLLLCLLVPLGSGERQPPPPRLSGRAAAELRGQGPLRAGAARVDLRIAPGGPVAGYPAPRRDDGSGTPLAARALVLEAGGLELLVATLPVLLISPDLEEEVVRKAGLPPQSCLLLAATHTHSGPGGYWDDRLGALGGVGLFEAARRERLAEAAARALAAARAALRPARLVSAQADWPRGPAQPRAGHAIDPSVTALRLFDERDAPLATLVDYAMHATVIPRASRGLSGDWPEAASRALEEAGEGPSLLLQGAVGDTSWNRDLADPAGPEETARLLGRSVARFADELLAGHLPSAQLDAVAGAAPGGVALGCSVRILPLPVPEAGRAIPWPLRRPLSSALRLAAPRSALAVTLQLPGLRFVGVPGEPVGELGLTARGGGAEALVGLADGYAGYVETAANSEQGSGESLRTWYGPSLAAALGLPEPRR
jgi:hypothetical protein